MRTDDRRGKVSGERGGGRRRPRPDTAPANGPLRPSQMLAAFFIPAVAFLVAGGLAALLNAFAGPSWARWLSLHLLLLGGISQLVLGAAQFFAAAFLATDPPRRKLILAQLVTWNVGVLMIAIGRPTGTTGLISIGGLFILVGLALFGAGLLEMKRRSLQSNHWAVRWYGAAALSLAAGALVGVLLAEGRTGNYADLLAAHYVLNLLGWLGTAIVGTLHTFFPSLTGTRLVFPRLEGRTFLAWIGGVALLAVGFALDSGLLTALGWLSLAVAAALLMVNLAACFRQRTVPPGLPARLISIAQPFLFAAVCVGFVATLSDGTSGPLSGTVGSLMPTLILAGWIGLTVAGSLLHLLAMLARVRSGFALAMPSPEPVRDLLITVAAAVGISALAASALVSSDALATAGRLLVLFAAVPVVAVLARCLVRVLNPGSPAAGPGAIR
jgi:nitrite reductase (NO-forming)